MRLEQIHYYLTIVECGSITKAAGKLYISQPALSKQIALLEDEIGVKLLKRQARGIRLTEAGEQFAADCRKIMQDLDSAVARAAALGNIEKKPLLIGCFDGAVTEDFLPKLQTQLKQINPNIQIKLSRHTFAENRAHLDSGQIDIMIELARKEKDGLIHTTSGLTEGKDDYHFYPLTHRKSAIIYSIYSPLAQKDPLTAEDIVTEPYLAANNREGPWLAEPVLDYLSKKGKKKPRVETVDNFMSLMSNLELGNGYCTLALSAADRNPNLLAWDLPEEYGTYVVAVWKKDNELVNRLLSQSST